MVHEGLKVGGHWFREYWSHECLYESFYITDKILMYVFVPDLNILIFNIETLFGKLCIAKFSVLLPLFSYLFSAHSAPQERKLIEKKHLIINDLLGKYQIKSMEFMFITHDRNNYISWLS